MDKHYFCFCQSSAQYYKWLEEMHPETFRKVKNRVEEGRWEIVGGTWVEPDANLPSGESLVRQFLVGKRYFAEKFGVDVKIAWFPDSFGYTWTLPQIMKKSGIDFFLTQKMLWNDTTVFPHCFFMWTAPDGSSILAHQTVGSYSETVDEPSILEQLKMLSSRHQLDDLLVLFGTGDHGGGVTDDMIQRAQEFVEGKRSVGGVFSACRDYVRTVTEKIANDKIPTVNDELYLQFHRGTYTTQANVKKNNRKAECLLESAEKFSTVAQLYGRKYPSRELDEAWQKLLLNQFHDVLPGSSIPEVYVDSEECFRSVFDTANNVVSEALRTIAARVDTSGEGKSVLVFNPLSWSRSGAVEVPMNELGDQFEIHDESGRVILSQTVEQEKIVFIAEDVPPIGYREYKATPRGPKECCATSLSFEETQKAIELGNEFFAIRIDRDTGLMTSAFDKRSNLEVFRSPGNLIQVFEDYPTEGRTCGNPPMDASIFDAWEVFIYQQDGGVKSVELNRPVEVKLIEKGPVRTRVLVTYKYVQEGRPDSKFEQEIILHHKIPLIEFKLKVDWHAAHRLAKVAFPLSIHSDSTTYEIPYGFIARRNPVSPNATPSERAKYEVPGQRWIDHTSENGEYGVSLLNDCKYGFDTAGDVIRMTLLRSASYPFALRVIFGLPVPENTEKEFTDQGEHSLAYALYPHSSDFKDALTARKAYEFNYPMVPLVEPNHAGQLQRSLSFISAEPENIILTVAKKAEDSNDIILRFFETCGKTTRATVRLPQNPRSATETDLMEKEVSGVPLGGNGIFVSTRGHEIKTVRVAM
jgi:alpha-mannosidase